ncbi:MAG: PhzF family phenazine biosynthesis isomerase [Bacteroidetes bacterium]|nr:PhzF family phenazine biosynthesis isomerase [Bacteroidota bacterium]
MSVRISQVDAFTSNAFAGNPAAVCVLPATRPAEWMQQVAREMNLSETAFLQRRDDGFALRWFTPTHEVDLCGHATLASAHVLWTDGHLPSDEPAVFRTKSGTLTARARDGWIAMDFPAEPLAKADAPSGLLAALGVAPVFVGRNRMDYGVLLEDEAAVRSVAPDLTRLAAVDTRGVIVTAPADDEADHDFVSRFFAPRVGVPEDPVTGSAHCALGPFWAERLGRTDLVGRQVSSRGGTVRIQVDPPTSERVLLMGQAVTVLQGELTVEKGGNGAKEG